jgi:hypothetical protein
MLSVLAPFALRLFSRFPEVLLALGHDSLLEDFELPPAANSCTVIEETGDYKLVQVLLGRRGCQTPQSKSLAHRMIAPVSVAANADVDRRKSRGAAAVQ